MTAKETNTTRSTPSSGALSRRLLRRVTLVFLALPVLIFLGGWLRLPLAVGAGALWIAAAWRLMADDPRDRDAPPALSWPLLAAVAGLAAVVTFLSGAGGWGAGDDDWLKHDTILRDLLTRPWPVTYESGHGPVLLVYYTGFYLPAALLGKLAGGSWAVASQALALTMFTGTTLAGAWLVTLGRGVGRTGGWIALAVFGGFSGLDLVGKALVNRWNGLPVGFGDWSDIEWWAQFAQYPSNAASLFWAPQHALAGWLPLALALDDWFHGENALPRRAAWTLAVAAVWSPLAAVGLLPLVGAMAGWRAWQGKELRAGWRSLLTLENAAGVTAGGLFALYLCARFQPYPLPAEYVVKPGFTPMPLLDIDHLPMPLLYALFVGIEFAGLSAALWWFLAGRTEDGARDERFLLLAATATLLVLPTLRYGYANDLVMRGGGPALFLLQALLVRMFARAGHGRRQWAVWLAAALLVAGLGNTAIEYRRHIVRLMDQGSWRDSRTREPVRSLAELHRTVGARPGFDLARQYLGAADGVFGRHLAARRGALGPHPPPRPPDF